MKKILISRHNGETQILILNDDAPQSFFVERDNEPPRLVGSIFKAKVGKILPGINAAFVDIGRGQDAFLPFQNKILSVGDTVLLQIEKDAEHYKAARATLEISLPARKIILLPNSNKLHFSRKLPPTEKTRLKNWIKKILPANCGVIIRTAAENATVEELVAEILERLKFWQELLKIAANKKKPSLVYGETLIERIMRENFFDCENFITDNLKIFNRIVELKGKSEKIQHYECENLFKMFGVDTEIKSLKQKELNLPSGGFIVIEKTEALTVIDVNTGGADDVFQTNIEAAELAMKQIRLRNIGGIIIIDFINLEKSDGEKLFEYLVQLSQIDSGKVNVVDITPLGLAEITRQPY